MKHAVIHQHQRQRAQCKTYPHPNKWVRILDNAILAISVILPITTLPQVWTIWVDKNAGGVSLITWSFYLLFSIPYLAYGIVHRTTPLIIMYTLWIIVHTAVVIGTIIYG